MSFSQLRRLAEQGHLVQARAGLEHRIHSGSLSEAEAVEAYTLLAGLLFHQHDLFAAAHTAERALRLAQQHGGAAQIIEARFQLGVALTELGDSPAAIPHLEFVLANAHQLEKGLQLTARAFFAIGNNRVRRREYAEAARIFAQAAEQAQALGDSALAARATRSTAWCYLHLDRPAEAITQLNWLQDYIEQHPDDLHIRHALLVDWALYHRICGDIALSSRYCQQLFASDAAGISDEHRTEAAWVAGANALDLGRPGDARLFARLALDYAVRAQWPFAINQATNLLNRIRLAEQTA